MFANVLVLECTLNVKRKKILKSSYSILLNVYLFFFFINVLY